MNLEYSNSDASGPGAHDFHVLVHRIDTADPECPGESLVVHRKGTWMSSVVKTVGRYMDLWRSPGGTVFVSGGDCIHWSSNPIQGGGEWNHHRNIYSLGVWGLDDHFVLTWGDVNGEKMFRFDGINWHEIDAPGWVMDLHGVRPDLIVAGCTQGNIARFDGKDWQVMPSELTGKDFTAVHVVSESEMYAILGHNQVWAGSVDGWSPVTEIHVGDPFQGIAKWKDKVWVADCYKGLSVLEGSELTVAKPNLLTHSLDMRENLLITHDNGVSNTEDGGKFFGLRLNKIIDMLESERPGWL